MHIRSKSKWSGDDQGNMSKDFRSSENGGVSIRQSAASLPRADLVIAGLRADSPSYEGRVFFNTPDATEETPLTLEAGYAGSFHVFGHSFCGGGEGHCTPRTRGSYDLRPPHHLAPFNKNVIVTGAVRRLAAMGELLTHIKIVPVVRHNPIAKSQSVPNLKFSDAHLELYSDARETLAPFELTERKRVRNELFSPGSSEIGRVILTRPDDENIMKSPLLLGEEGLSISNEIQAVKPILGSEEVIIQKIGGFASKRDVVTKK